MRTKVLAKTRASARRLQKPERPLRIFEVERADGKIEKLQAHHIDWQTKAGYLALWRVSENEQLELVKIFNGREWRTLSEVLPAKVSAEAVTEAAVVPVNYSAGRV